MAAWDCKSESIFSDPRCSFEIGWHSSSVSGGKAATATRRVSLRYLLSSTLSQPLGTFDPEFFGKGVMEADKTGKDSLQTKHQQKIYLMSRFSPLNVHSTYCLTWVFLPLQEFQYIFWNLDCSMHRLFETYNIFITYHK